MCWLLFMCFVWPLKVLQTDSVLWKAFIELSQLRQTVLWEVSSPSSTDLELFSLRETEPLVTSVGSFGRWDTVVAAGACGAASHQEQNSASWLWSWEWPVCVLCCQGAFPCTWQFVVLAVEVLCPVSSTKKKKAVKWKETSQRLLGGQHCYISFALDLLLHNASAKWMLY